MMSSWLFTAAVITLPQAMTSEIIKLNCNIIKQTNLYVSANPYPPGSRKWYYDPIGLSRSLTSAQKVVLSVKSSLLQLYSYYMYITFIRVHENG